MADNTPELSTTAETLADLASSQLSALVDGELAAAETDLVVLRLSRDAATQQHWERYHLIRNALQGQLPQTLDRDFAARLQRHIAQEQNPPAPRFRWRKRHWAMAASLALAVLVGLNLTRTPEATPPIATLPTSPPSPPSPGISNAIASLDAERLNNYLVNHNGHASGNSVNGMLPYVRMVGYQSER